MKTQKPKGMPPVAMKIYVTEEMYQELNRGWQKESDGAFYKYLVKLLELGLDQVKQKENLK